jgi:predicted  nucleic acid-binding Zn-ribbon protein
MRKNNENKIFGKKNIPSANNKGIKMNTNKKGEYTQNTTPKNNKKVITKSGTTSNLAKENNRYETNIKKENNNNNKISPSNLFTNKEEILNTNININEKLNSIQQLFEGKLDGFMEKINEKFNNIEKEYNTIIKQNTKILNYNKALNENFENLQKETSKNLSEFQNQLKKNNEKDLSPEIIKLQEKEKKYQNDIYYYKNENEKLNEQIKILKEENNNLKKEIENKETKMTENDFGNKTYYNSKINVHRSIETKMVFDVLNIDKNNNINSVENKEYILIGLKPIKEIPFLNCIIQCLNQTELLTNYFLLCKK